MKPSSNLNFSILIFTYPNLPPLRPAYLSFKNPL